MAAGFTLLEVLSVMGIMAIIMTLAVPALRSLTGASGVNRASADLSRTLELARVYAMARQTYVRVGFSEVPGQGTVVMSFYAADGTQTAGGKTALEDAGVWPQLGEPLVLRDFKINDALNAKIPSTQSDAKPSDSTDFEKFRRRASGIKMGSQDPEFSQFVQFSPSGEARVRQDAVARYIKIGLVSANDRAAANPFIIRLSGSNGTINILRNEDL